MDLFALFMSIVSFWNSKRDKLRGIVTDSTSERLSQTTNSLSQSALSKVLAFNELPVSFQLEIFSKASQIFEKEVLNSISLSRLSIHLVLHNEVRECPRTCRRILWRFDEALKKDMITPMVLMACLTAWTDDALEMAKFRAWL